MLVKQYLKVLIAFFYVEEDAQRHKKQEKGQLSTVPKKSDGQLWYPIKAKEYIPLVLTYPPNTLATKSTFSPTSDFSTVGEGMQPTPKSRNGH